MQVRSLSIAAALVASAASLTTSVRAADRAAQRQEAIAAAHTMGYGEVGPLPAGTQPVSAAERMDARTRRMADGYQAARNGHGGEVYWVPAASTTPRGEQPAAPAMTAAERRAEVRRANLAGELTSPGEAGR